MFEITEHEQYHWFVQQGRNNLLSEIYKLPDLNKKGKDILCLRHVIIFVGLIVYGL